MTKSLHAVTAKAYLPEYTVPARVVPAQTIKYSEQTIYACGFEAGLDGWAAFSGSAIAIGSKVGQDGDHALLVNKPGTGTAQARRTLTGFIPGLRYNLSAKATAQGADVTITVNAIGGTPIAGSGGIVGDWNGASLEFTATSSSHVLSLNTTTTAGQGAWWDRVVVRRVAQTITIPSYTIPAYTVPAGTPTELDIIESVVTLDDSWAPYAQLLFRCWTPPEAALKYIDPRDNLRVSCTVGRQFGAGGIDWNPEGYRPPESRPFDLVLSARTADLGDGTMLVEVESDESLAQSTALMGTAVVNPGGTSVRGAVEFGLNKIGATIGYEFPAINLFPNPLFSNPSSGLAQLGTSYLVGTSAGSAINAGTGTQQFNTTSINAGARRGAYFEVDTTDMSPKTLAVLFAKAGSAALACTLYVDFFNGATGVAHAVGSTQTVTSTATSGTLSLVCTPATPITKMRVYMWLNNPTGATVAASTTATFAQPRLSTSGAIPFFTGATADTSTYDYSWSGAVNLSPSIRTRLYTDDAAVDPASLDWTPGTTVWDYLKPLVQAAGLRLYCDELRVWRLVSATATKDGLVRLAVGLNITKATDRISSTDNAEYYTGVVVEYHWFDSSGLEHYKWDSAGTPGKVKKIAYERPWPRAGAAAAILARSKGKGRVFDVEAMSDYTAEPGKGLSITVPATADQTGYVRSVRWSFPDNRMRVAMRELTVTPNTAWIYDPPGARWQDIPVGIDWTEDL